jgi:hypothetical protein
MKVHKAILDISAHLVHLNSPMYGKVTLHLPAVARLKAACTTLWEESRRNLCGLRVSIRLSRGSVENAAREGH